MDYHTVISVIIGSIFAYGIFFPGEEYEEEDERPKMVRPKAPPVKRIKKNGKWIDVIEHRDQSKEFTFFFLHDIIYYGDFLFEGGVYMARFVHKMTNRQLYNYLRSSNKNTVKYLVAMMERQKRIDSGTWSTK